MSDLVFFLSNDVHPVELEPRAIDYAEIKRRLEDGFVFIKFLDTKGGTELGINVNVMLTDSSKVDFVNKKGTLVLVGDCELDYKKIRCSITVDMEKLKGEGSVKVL